jgi:glycyl-tRNA synthetase alpha chain
MCKEILGIGDLKRKSSDRKNKLVLPAYDQCIKASHLFNILDARGVISTAQRQVYIGRVRTLAKLCADSYINEVSSRA